MGGADGKRDFTCPGRSFLKFSAAVIASLGCDWNQPATRAFERLPFARGRPHLQQLMTSCRNGRIQSELILGLLERGALDLRGA
jgi:hypothetical protein